MEPCKPLYGLSNSNDSTWFCWTYLSPSLAVVEINVRWNLEPIYILFYPLTKADSIFHGNLYWIFLYEISHCKLPQLSNILYFWYHLTNFILWLSLYSCRTGLEGRPPSPYTLLTSTSGGSTAAMSSRHDHLIPLLGSWIYWSIEQILLIP